MSRKNRLIFVIAVAFSLIPSGAMAGHWEQEYVVIAPGDNDIEFELYSIDRFAAIKEISTVSAVSRPALSPDGRWIAFSGYGGTGDDGRYPLKKVKLDGSGLVTLTSGVGADFDPAWSPDGLILAFSRDVLGNLEASSCCHIWVISVVDGSEQMVPNTLGGVKPSWDPFGERLVYETPSGLFVVGVDGTAKSKIAPSGSHDPAWSPSGAKIAFVRRVAAEPPADELVVLNLDSGATRRIFGDGSRIESPLWHTEAVLDFLTFDGYGYSDRTNARIRTADKDGRVSVVYNGESEAVFIGAPNARCSGAAVLGGLVTGPGLQGIDAPNDCFSSSISSGDFNGDGFSDVSVGVVGELSHGSVTVMFGSSGPGLSGVGDLRFTQDSAGVAGNPESDDRFGESLAVGDFNNDGFDDLVVGVPGEDLGQRIDDGGVTELVGSGPGLIASESAMLNQRSPGMLGAGEADDRFGESLAVGDFNNDGFDDLVVGVPGEDLGRLVNAGSLAVVKGSVGGLVPLGNQRFQQGN